VTIKEIGRLYKNGTPIEYIAELCDTTTSDIRECLQLLGIEVKPAERPLEQIMEDWNNDVATEVMMLRYEFDTADSLYSWVSWKRKNGYDFKFRKNSIQGTRLGKSERFGNKLRRLRRSQGMTQSDLARLMGVSQQSICDLEHGAVGLSTGHIERARAVFGEAI